MEYVEIFKFYYGDLLHIIVNKYLLVSEISIIFIKNIILQPCKKIIIPLKQTH